MIDLSIIIVSYNSGDVLLPCLESIYKSKPLISFEIIIVDNGSKDGSICNVGLHFKKVKIIEIGHNLGYGAGNNVGYENSKGRNILFLNPDTLITKGSLDKIVLTADSNPGCGIVGPKILNKDGSLQRSCFKAPNLIQYLFSTLRTYRLPFFITIFGFPGYYPNWNDENEREVDAVSGCCLLIRREIINKVGVFDNNYFMYFEEIDLCERVRQWGYTIIYTQKATITHLGGTSIDQGEAWLCLEFERSRRQYFKKYRSKLSEYAVRIILFVNSLVLIFSGIFERVLTNRLSKKSTKKFSNALNMLSWQIGIKKHSSKLR